MNYLERCLYEYKVNCASLLSMKEELNGLKSVHSQSYDIHSVNGVFDLVFDVTAKTLALTKCVLGIERRIKPVELLRAGLAGSEYKYQQMREVLELKYFEHESNSEVQRKMAVSERTFRRRKRELLEFARQYFVE